MGWIQGSTPTIAIGIPKGIDLRGYRIMAYVKQGNVLITKTSAGLKTTEDDDLYGSVVDFYLSQADTLRFEPGVVKYQLRWINQAGKSGGTRIIEDTVEESIAKDVISYA